VTSSSTLAGGACAAAGIGPTSVHDVIGVTKAYSTRVGAGPFPTEMDVDTTDYFVEKGQEFGTTTGRRRRIGWFDGVAFRHAIALNGANMFALNKLDILSGLNTIKICTGYELYGLRVDYFVSTRDLWNAVPIYETFDGWEADISDIKTFRKLPVNAQRYVRAIEKLSGITCYLVSVGPSRDQTIWGTF
jgi:adenylosuccinate synthase